MSAVAVADAPSRRDPVLLEVIKHELASAMESVATVVAKTGRSPMLRAGDF